MSTQPTSYSTANRAAAAFGTAMGTAFFLFFGTIWILAGFSMQHLVPLRELIGLAVFVIIFGYGAWHVIRKDVDLAKQADPAEQQKRSRVFRNINIAQWVAVVVVIIIANVIQKPQIILPSIILIVGLHFLPFARAFRYFPHYVTGVAI